MPKKKTVQLHKYAFIALIVAGLALVASILLAVVQGLAVMQLFTPPNAPAWKNALWISLALIVIGIAVYGIMAPDKVRRFITGRQARYGSNSLIMFLAVIGILIIVNVLSYQYPASKDFTEDQTNTLAKETVQALATLPGKVTATAFYSSRLPTDDAQKLLENFKNNSRGKFDYHFVDPDTNPVAARQAGITGDGKIMLTMGNQKEIASSATEQDLTQSLIRLISPEQHVIYFLTGHGEADTSSTGGDASYSVASTTLQSKNYTVKTLNLLADHNIPGDAQTIVIAGPQKPLSQEEVDALKKYVDSGHSLVVMEDPPFLTKFGDSPDPLAQYLANDWAITLDNDLIIDLQSSRGPLYATAVSRSQTQPITQTMTLTAIFPQARSITIGSPAPNITDTSLIQTSSNSWGETDFNSLASNQAKYDEGQDIPGPLNMAVAGENSKTKGRVVVFGNSIFAENGAFDAYGNGDIFINSVDWAAAQENLINITPRTPKQRTFNIPTQIQWVAILLGSIFILPGLVVLAGVSTWIVQRKRG